MKLTLAAALSALLVGCAQLSVEVDVLDQSYWQSPEWMAHERIVMIQDTYHDFTSGRVQQDLTKVVADAVQSLSEGPQAVVDSSTVGAVTAQMAARVAEILSPVAAKVNKAYETAAASAKDEEERIKHTNDAWPTFVAAQAELRLVPQQLSEDLRKNVRTNDPSAVAASQAEIAREGEEVVKGYVGNHGILDDLHASAVVNAPDEYWHGQFNKTYASGQFGNIDIAIKMEEIGNFTIKGVRNDAAAITRATFAVGQQAVQTIAALYGIPVPKAGTTPSADAKAISPPDIASPHTRTKEAEAKLADLRAARTTLLEALLAQADRLSDPAPRKAALAAAKDALSRFEAQVNGSK